MIARLWRRIAYVPSPPYDPEQDPDVRWFRQQRDASERRITQMAHEKDLTRLYGELRPFWKQPDDRTHDPA